MHRSSYEMLHFSSYDVASQSWYSTFASFGSAYAAATSSAVTPLLVVSAPVTPRD